MDESRRAWPGERDVNILALEEALEDLAKLDPAKVRLVELPAGTEYEDNIVAFHRPATALRAGVPSDVAYRLRWGRELRRPEAFMAIELQPGALDGLSGIARESEELGL